MVVKDNKPAVAKDTKPVVAKEERPSSLRSASPGARDHNKATERKSVVIVTKDTDVVKDAKDKEKKTETQTASQVQRRDSPVLRDRAEKSKTIAGAPTLNNAETNAKRGSGSPSSSPVVKRTQSQKANPVSVVTPVVSSSNNNEATTKIATTTEPEKRPRWEPKQKEDAVQNGGSGGQPSWIAMARRKTGGWDENRDPEKELKEASNKAKKEDDDEACIIIEVRAMSE